ncbi:MAG: hypothetical protein HQ498_03980 [Pseudohongiella sp.]|nr:hypothetical protein [Pseudohongiella sp.]
MRLFDKNKSGVKALISVLFAREDSIYKQLPGCDVWDEKRNALNFRSNNQVVAHPPCRGWGRLRKFASVRPGELALAHFAVDVVQQNGGVLEHPSGSSLWLDRELPVFDEIDSFGGFTLKVYQSDWGHKARKSTLLYIVGSNLNNLPRPSLCLGKPEYVVAPGKGLIRKSISKEEREHTPILFAQYLIEIAKNTVAPGCNYDRLG